MPTHPAGQQVVREIQRCAHRGGAFGRGFKPHGEFHLLNDFSTRAVVNFFRALIHAGRGFGDFTQGHQIAASQRSGKGGTNLRTVTNDADIVKITHAFAARTFDDEIVQQSVNGVRYGVAFTFAITPSDGFHHRARLVDQENEATRVGPTDLC